MLFKVDMINCKSPEAKLWQFIAVQSKICLHKGSFMFETEDLTGQYVNIYIRVSTDEQAKKGYSIDMQEDQCRKYIERLNGAVNKVYIDDGYSGKNLNRPQIKQLMEDLKSKKNRVTAVVTWRCDRMIRSTDYYYQVLKPLFGKQGVTLLSATEPNEGQNNPYGKWMRNSQINNAELESGLISIRTVMNLQEKARQGHYPGARVPVGYKRNKNREIIPDEEKRHYIEKIFRLYSTGAYSFETLAAKMRKEGFTHNNKPCSKKTIENILSVYQVFYIGKFNYSFKQNDGTYIVKLCDGKHEPIISLALYEAAMRVKDRASGPKENKHSFLYKGLIRCSISNRLLTPEKQRGANKSGEYEYYRCHRPCPECPKDCKRIIKREVIDKAVIEALETLNITKEQLKNLKEDVKNILHYQADYDEKRKIQIEGDIKKLKNRINQLYDDKLDGIISESTYLDKKLTWENKLENLTLEYTALTKTNIELIRRFEKMFELSENLTQRYLEKSVDKKREILKILCSNFFYEGSELRIELESAFTALIKLALNDKWAGNGIRTHVYRNHNPRS